MMLSIKKNEPRNVLLIGNVSRRVVGSYYLKALLELNFNVLTISRSGTFWINQPFGWAQIVYYLHYYRFSPDMILIIEDSEGIQFDCQLKNKVNIPSAYLSIDTALRYEQHLKLSFGVRHLFISQKDYLPYFQSNGQPNVHWLPYCCDPDIQHPLNVTPTYDVVFAGHCNHPMYGERQALLNTLKARYNTHITNNAYWKDMTTLYSQGKIVFNQAPLHAYNFRTFEVLACGRLLLTNRVDNGLQELLQDGRHLVFYDNGDHMCELMDYYLAHPERADAIAKAGLQEVVSNHTYQHRIKKIIQTLFP